MTSTWSPADWLSVILLALNALDTIGTIAIAIVLLWLRSIFATKRAHEQLADRVQGHGDRLNRGDARMQLIEQRLSAAPSIESMNNLALSIERLSGDMRALGTKIEGMDGLHKALERQVGVMDEWMRGANR